MLKKSFPTPIEKILIGLIKDYGLEGRMTEFRLIQKWPEIVGNPVSLHARPDYIRFHKLYLLVDSPGWIQELTFLKPDLLRKINSALPGLKADFKINDIVLRLDGGGSS